MQDSSICIINICVGASIIPLASQKNKSDELVRQSKTTSDTAGTRWSRCTSTQIRKLSSILTRCAISQDICFMILCYLENNAAYNQNLCSMLSILDLSIKISPKQWAISFWSSLPLSLSNTRTKQIKKSKIPYFSSIKQLK